MSTHGLLNKIGLINETDHLYKQKSRGLCSFIRFFVKKINYLSRMSSMKYLPFVNCRCWFAPFLADDLRTVSGSDD